MASRSLFERVRAVASPANALEIAKKAYMRRVRHLKKFPPVVNQSKLVFYSAEDFSDNPRALFEYLQSSGLAQKLEIVWLVENPERFKDHESEGVRFVALREKFLGVYSFEARKEVLSAGTVLYSHSMNWADPIRQDQVFIDLWHGCGYKAQKPGVKRTVFFDYCLVPGEFFVPVKAEFFKCPPRKIVPIGYPRYDWFKTRASRAHAFADELKAQRKARKLVMWMPTFRRSTSESLSESTLVGDFDLPIAGDAIALSELDEACKQLGIVVLLKRHMLEQDYDFGSLDLANIVMLDSSDLEAQDVNLYELLAASDALVSDYSSVAIDYLLLDKPIGFAIDDFEQFQSGRGWSFDDPLAFMPGHHMFAMVDFLNFLTDLANGRDPHAEQRRSVRAALHNECDSYCARIVDQFGIGGAV